MKYSINLRNGIHESKTQLNGRCVKWNDCEIRGIAFAIRTLCTNTEHETRYGLVLMIIIIFQCKVLHDSIICLDKVFNQPTKNVYIFFFKIFLISYVPCAMCNECMNFKRAYSHVTTYDNNSNLHKTIDISCLFRCHYKFC